ncbi:MAG: heparan-alpha-glucosaminide N-acetyltransferase domain-containing protein [Pseudomonadota bacterium]
MTAAARSRIESVDVVRGIVIVLMALDHTRDFFGDLAADPTAMATTTPTLFFTRWITHFCAPAFFLLTGTGAYLALGKMSKMELARYLVSRGVWLIFLELVVMRFALQFNIDYQVTIVTVLWALGWAMIALAGLIWLPVWAIATLGIAMVAGHNLLDGISPSAFGVWAPLWTILHAPGILLNTGHSVVVISYVLIPWIGVTALGFCLGRLFQGDAARRKALLSWLGIGLCTAFLILRLANIYGDPLAWSGQRSPLWTLISFLNLTKYPPSLLFLLMTLGPALLLLRAFEDRVPRIFQPALVIGKVPLFFFLAHFFLIHLLAVFASWLRYGEIGEMFRSPDLAHFPFSQPPAWGESLPVIYAIWIGVVLIMYPLCRWYARVKQNSKSRWLSYL